MILVVFQHAVLRRQREQLSTLVRDQLLVRRDHMFTRSQRGSQPTLGRVEPTHQLNHHIHIRRREHILHALAQTVPLAKTMDEQISRLRAWAEGRARNASTPPDALKTAAGRHMEL